MQDVVELPDIDLKCMYVFLHTLFQMLPGVTW